MADIFDEGIKPLVVQGEKITSPKGIAQKSGTLQSELEKQQYRNKLLNFNGSSYSGVDIKVVVHKYGSPTVDLRSQVESAINAYEEVSNQMLTLATRVLPMIVSLTSGRRSGTVSEAAYQEGINDYRRVTNAIDAIENSVSGSGMNQFIGPSLAGRLVDAQRNPAAFSLELLNTVEHLKDVIRGWRQQSSALGARTVELVSTKTLAELQTISISTFREKKAVRALGFTGAKGFTRAQRTIAGSMIFTVFDRNVLFELLETTSFDSDDKFTAAIKDQLPPLDMTIMFANEYGALSRMGLYGVEFVSEGQTMSIEDIILEDVCQFVARDVDPMTPVVNAQGEPYNVLLSNYNQAVAAGDSATPLAGLRASDLRGSDFDLNRNGNAAVTRYRNRQNPFF
jgi:hypothetical protein